MSRLNIVRKIRENHQNYNISKDLDYKAKKDESEYIIAKMGDVYGHKGNYHLNEYNIEYLGDLKLDKNNQKYNNFRIRNIKHNNSKNLKGNDFLNINYLKEQFNDNHNDKRRGKSSYRPNNSNSNNKEDLNKKINSNKALDNDIKIENDNNKNNQNKTDNLYYTFDNNNNNNFPNNINNYFMSCKFLFTMGIDEIEEYLEILWKQLCIKNNYINIFNSQKKNFDNTDELIDFLILEIENLKKFEDIMIKLSKEIESRERNIIQIKNLCEKMNENNEEDNNNKINKKIMDDFFNSIISYRVHSIKVVEYYLLFKEKIIQGNSIEKFNEENIMKKYGLIKNGCNYLIKMKNDMSFINNSKIINNRENFAIFNSLKGDPFLTSLYNIIPVSREYKQRIKYCHYFIIQEIINENLKKNNTINNKLIDLNNNLNGLKDYKNYKKKKLEPIINHSNYKENTQININNTNQIIINKNKDNSEFDFSKKYNKSAINSNKNDIDNYNNEISKINITKENENKNHFNFYYNDDDMVNIQNTENNYKNDNTNKLNINKIEIYKNKDNYEDINNNLNINYEKEKKVQINNKDNIKKEENILKNSLTISKKMKNKKESSRSATPESKKLTNVVPSENINNKNNLNSSIILDNDKINLSKYNTSYYCGNLSDFIIIYNNYYQRVPIEQKRIFNIKENPINYFKNNYFPKIIITSDTKLTLIKGICIYSHIFHNNENKSNNIIIEHLSAYNNEEMENIFKNIFDFLKNNNILINSNINNISNEIYIDLYFYLENEKFIIDTKIRDFIKNELKFKWVKLENLSKKIRYQKMKHIFNNKNNLLNNEIDDNNILNQSILGIKALKDKNEGENNDRHNNESEENTIEENCDNNLFCNFYIKNKSIIKYINQKDFNSEKGNNNLIFNNIKYINPFNFIYLIKKISEDSIYSEYIINNTYNFFTMNDHLDIEEILNNNDGVSLNDILSSNSFLSSDIQKLINHFNDNNKNKEGNNKFDINSKINIFPIFDNCISIKYKNYFFNRIEQDNIKILIEKETKQKFFFISPNNNKTDNIILLISSSLNEQFKYKYISPQNNSNISLKFIDIYNNIISSESNDNKKYLYIPSFEINSKIKNLYKKHRKPDNEEEFDNNNETYIINEYEEYFNLKLLSEDFIGESIKYKNKKNKNSSINFYFNEIEEDYIKNKDCILDDDFIIFILNFDIIDNFAAIPLMSLYITKDNFIS